MSITISSDSGPKKEIADEDLHDWIYKKVRRSFLTRLKNAGARRLFDIRLNNISQLAGFTKRDDLRYFTKTICNIDYYHCPDLAPTQDILDAFKKQKGDWGVYERQFLDLMRRSARRKQCRGKCWMEVACFARRKPDQCHRRFVAEYLKDNWGNVEIEHIL